jgi:hypothetical protein
MESNYSAYEQEVMEEIYEEVQEYADNLERSEEEGWFYADEDED